jgi:hypothetical protein
MIAPLAKLMDWSALQAVAMLPSIRKCAKGDSQLTEAVGFPRPDYAITRKTMSFMAGFTAVALWGYSLGARYARMAVCRDARLASVVWFRYSVINDPASCRVFNIMDRSASAANPRLQPESNARSGFLLSHKV